MKTYFYAILSLVLTAGAVQSVCAQDKGFARKIMDTLTSADFAGRGYVDHGDKKAAAFIAKNFQDFGLQVFAGARGYIQPFEMPVNTFPGKMIVTVDQAKLIPGKDFIVDPESGGCRQEKLILVFIDSVRLSEIVNGNPGKYPHKKFAIAIDKKLLEKSLEHNGFGKIMALKPAAIFSITDGRLIWSVSATHLDIPFIEIKRNALPAGTRSVTLMIDEEQKVHQTQNITGFVRGSIYPDSFIFITAHYDHLGEMGKGIYFPGANDNASGTSMLMDIARYFANAKVKPAYSIGFIAFAGEEAGLVGSKYYTTHPIVPLDHIAFLINMDLMANGQDGMMVVNGSVFPHAFSKLVQINDSGHYLKLINKRGKAANSDHYWFSENGVHAFFFYLLGDYPYYHDIYDTVDKPTYAGYDGAFRLIRDFVISFNARK
jgi:aminopeptidase YwaD